MTQLKDALNNPKAIIIDVRTPSEHNARSLSCPHILKPLHELDCDSFCNEHNLLPESELYFLCHKGGRAAQAAAQFKAKGFQNCHVIDGGIEACESQYIAKNSCGSRKAIPLDGQVRIAIGFILLMFSVFTILINPIFLYIIPLIGIALIISGITGWCGLANCLARAPWNR